MTRGLQSRKYVCYCPGTYLLFFHNVPYLRVQVTEDVHSCLLHHCKQLCIVLQGKETIHSTLYWRGHCWQIFKAGMVGLLVLAEFHLFVCNCVLLLCPHREPANLSNRGKEQTVHSTLTKRTLLSDGHLSEADMVSGLVLTEFHSFNKLSASELSLRRTPPQSECCCCCCCCFYV